MKNALKNCAMFFGTAIVGVIAIFIFFGTIMPVPPAHAYAIGSVPPTGSSYDFGSSLQNLISPFTGFIDSLKLNNNTTINTNGTPGTTWPVVNFTPGVASGIQNLLSQWLSQFDNWFYSVTGVQLSGILVAILGVFSWALGLAQQAVNWLLGLFH